MLVKNLYKFSNALEGRLFLVTHHYVSDMYYKRILYRKQHEELLEQLQSKGNKIVGSQLFPMDGANYIFNSVDDSAAKEFVKKDPYIKNDLVVSWEIEELDKFTSLKFDRLAQVLTYK